MKSSDANTPMKTAADEEKHKLHYMDPSMFTGPMTQLMKAVFNSSPDPEQSSNVMQVDIECSSLPNLNETFADIVYDGFDQTPKDVRIRRLFIKCLLFLSSILYIKNMNLCVY